MKKSYGPKSIEAYRKTEVMTANRETILLMMYSGALRFLKQAIDSKEPHQVADRVRLVTKTQEIITELRSTLNFEVGGDLAHTLDALYSYLAQRLTQGTLENKVEYLQEVLTHLTTLNEAWEQAIVALKKEKNKSESKSNI
jgi:flagellar secretion chaperone FliS